MMLAYYTSGHIAEIHYAYALNDVRRAVEILGDRLNADTKGDADSHERAARARLIAAAPEMLPIVTAFAALPINDKTRDDVPVYGLDGVYITHGDVRKARAAIAKAKGDAE
jgi:hypothetical protein